MFTDPVFELDVPLVQEELEEEIGNKIGAIIRAGVTAEELMSSAKFEALLIKAGMSKQDIPMKLSLRTNKFIPAFAAGDDGFQELLNHADEKIRLLAQARKLVKSTIGETRAARFLELGRDGRKVPVHLNYAKAHTFRWSGGDKTNMQNLKRGGRLRRALKAAMGKHVVVADSGQIEARVTAWLAGDHDLLDKFAALTPDATSDVYTEFASLIFGRQVIKITDANKADFDAEELKFHKMARHVGKTCILGLGYSMGPKKLDDSLRKQGLKLGLDFCRKAVDTYRGTNWRIKQFWKECDDLLAHMAAGGKGTFRGMPYGRDWIKLPSGLFLRYPDLRATEVERWDGRVDVEYSYKTLTGRNKIYGGSMTENLAQALARCIIAEQMLEIEDCELIERIATMTHDEVVGITTAANAPAALKAMLEILATSPRWCPDLPLAAEGGHAPEYSK
jgi:DNA polymerase